MNYSQLEYFVATVENGSFSSASKALFITPQAISKAVSELEKELGAQLLTKNGRRISPTPLGLLFSEKAHEALEYVLDLKSFVEYYSNDGSEQGAITLAVASSPYRGNIISMQNINKIKNALTKLDIIVIFNSNSACLSALSHGLVDAAIIAGRVENADIDCYRLFSFKPQLAMSSTHPLSKKTSIRASDLCSYNIARPTDLGHCYRIITNHLRNLNIEPQYVDIEPFISSYRKFFLEDQGVMFAAQDPEFMRMHKNTVLKSFSKNEGIDIPICLACSKTHDSKALSSFKNYLAKHGSLFQSR